MMQNDNHPAASSSTTFHKPAVSNLTKNLMSSTPAPSSSSTHMDYDSSNAIHSNVNSNASGNADAANNSSNIHISNAPPSENDSNSANSDFNHNNYANNYNSNINTNHASNDNDGISSNIVNTGNSVNSIKTIINSINTNTNTNGNTVNANNMLHPSARIPTAVPVAGSTFSTTEPTSSSFHSSSYRAPGFYSTPANDSINYIPSSHNTPTVVSSSYSSVHSYTPSLPNSNNLQSFTSTNSNVNPFNSSNTAVSQQQQLQQQQSLQNATKSSGFVPQSMPTTTISMDSVNSTSKRDSFASASSSFNPSFSVQPTPTPPLNQNQLQNQQQSQNQQDRFPSSFGTAPFGTAPASSSYHHHPYFRTANRPIPNAASSSVTAAPPVDSGYLSSSHQQSQQYIQPEPDHYMSYKEFLHNLSVRDGNNPPPGENASIYDGHLNIVDYPVNDLILMLSCLLTKIIEANDKLHPNHFDNTIAMRQKLKEERRMKKTQQAELKEQRKFTRRQERERARVMHRSGSLTTSDSNMETTRQLSVGGGLIVDVDVVDVADEDDNIEVDHDDANSHSNPIDIDSDDDDDDDDEDLVIDSQDEDDEQDEMKNKYLANVLAFHGTNVPGISLHAYLARVLKYCPVTNEVFLSLLVYFDRIAKKANNLNQKRKTSSGTNAGGSAINEDTASAGDSEQLFVMDSYNIHRLIISGITVSSKFFSDIFYKNLRYAKVGGLPLEELNYLELQFLLLLDFKLMISVEDLQNYGDLLLRFWKREQITNELVHNTNNTNNNSNANASNIGDPSEVGNQKDGLRVSEA